MLRITSSCSLDSSEISFTFVRSPGPGGQNVNKLATAALLRVNITHSPSLTDTVRARLVLVLGPRLTQHGDLIIKASRYRTQERNRQDALERLQHLLQHAAIPPKPRKKTRPTRSSVQERLAQKKQQGQRKTLRGRVSKDHT